MFFRNWGEENRVEDGESESGCRGDGWRQRLIRWPGGGREFDGARTLLLAGRRNDLEPRNPVGRAGGPCFGYSSNLQTAPGSLLRFYPASCTVLVDRWPQFHPLQHATWLGPCTLGPPAGSQPHPFPAL